MRWATCCSAIQARRDEKFEQLLRDNPVYASLLSARRATLLDEDDVALHEGIDPKRIDLNGKILSGKYRILRLRGEGGLGSVWEAVDVMLGATVAVKVLHPRARATRRRSTASSAKRGC